jgi:multicomponent K+:H+ antiporter subunit D
LIGDAIAAGRGPAGDAIRPGERMIRSGGLAVMFFVCAMAIIGLPPLGGFIGKAMLLASAGGDARGFVWAAILLASLATMIGFARAYSTLFWKAAPDSPDHIIPPATTSRLPAVALLTATLLFSVAAGPLERFTAAAAKATVARGDYIQASLTARARPGPHSQPYPGSTP